MQHSFKPQLENLESRQLMDAAGAQAFCRDVFVPPAQPAGEIATVAPIDANAFAGQTVRLRFTAVNNEIGHSLGLMSDLPQLESSKEMALKGQKILQNATLQEGICHGVTVLAWARVDGVS